MAALGVAKETWGSLDTRPASPLSQVDRAPQWRHLLVGGRSVLPALGSQNPVTVQPGGWATGEGAADPV